MPKRTTLVLITDRFPQPTATESSFVVPELESLRKSFGRVIIVPTTLEDKVLIPPLPGIEVETGWARSADWRRRIRRARFLALPSVWADARGDISRRGLALGVAARAFASFLRKMMRTKGLRWDETLFYTFWFDFPAASLALLKRKNQDLKFVSRAHGHDMLTTLGGRLRRKMLSATEKLYCASDGGTDFVRAMFPAEGEGDKAVTELLGCLKLFPDAMSSRHVRGDRKWTFLSVARVDANKRVALNARLLKALAVARPDTEIRWIHIGDGPCMDVVKPALESSPVNFKSELRGMLTNEAVQRVYRDETIDWTMLLSEVEGGRPVAVCESLAYGVPVIVSDIPGLNEIVDDDCGMILPVDTTDEEFVRGIAPYLDSDYRSAALREAAFARWSEEYNASVLRPAFVERITGIL